MKHFLVTSFCFLSQIISAQVDSIVVDTDYHSMKFIEFVDAMESKHHIRFYFKDSWFDTVYVNQRKTPSILPDILSNTFDGTSFNYLVDGKNIIVTKNYRITKHLPDNYFDRSDKPTIPAADTVDLKYAFLEKTEKKEIKSKNGTLVIGNPANRLLGHKALLSGVVRNEEDGEPIIGAAVFIKDLGIGTVTDIYGYYVITVPKGYHDILYKFVGRIDLLLPVTVNDNGTLNVNMKQNVVEMKEVVVTADKGNIVKNMHTGLQQIDIEVVKQLPSSMGEADIIKSAILLPGVKTVGEGASGFNVRGGSADQNLILLDGIPIFNSSHLFGFFSVFNPELVNDFKLYKSGIPARYGGRVSSVFDVSARQGNLKKFVVSGGVSPVTGKLTIEGPVIKNKASILIGGRSTYSDWILKRLDRTEFKNSNADFYDASIKFSYDINEKNTLNILAYQSKDHFSLNSDSTYRYENLCAGMSYKHNFTRKFYGIFSALYSNYQYNISSSKEPVTSFNLKYNIEFQSFKTEFFFFPNTQHTLNFGSELIKYKMTPGDFIPLMENSDIKEMKLPKEYGIESGLFINDEYTVNNRLSISTGLRYAMFLALGPDTVYKYRQGATLSTESRIDTNVYNPNNIIKTYGGPELRVSARYKTGMNNSVKISYNRIYQFLHMLTNSASVSPTDVWKISDTQVKPMIGDQVAAGFYQNLFSNSVETSVEAYYKKTKNHLDYKGGTELLLNPDLEVSLLSGTGRAYGVEFMLRKKAGRLNGWISYTYSRTELKVNGTFTDEKINSGEYYPANYDKPHDISVVANFKYSRRISISGNFTYNTGRPVSYPVAKYNFRDRELIHYSNRNEYRIPDYLRLDLSLNFEGNLKLQKLAHSSWSVGVYNLTGRDNVYSVFFKTTPEGVKGYQLSVFARPVFNVTYNFRF
ncbi:MAG: TonB-dependent receptor [Bacteroidales bacterium]|nr:TonB-dependent receptor [Bacteroidales bacterium]